MSITYTDYLKMKSLIRRIDCAFGWRIEIDDDNPYKYTLSLDNGDQTYKTIILDKSEYDREDVLEIGLELSEELGVDLRDLIKKK